MINFLKDYLPKQLLINLKFLFIYFKIEKVNKHLYNNFLIKLNYFDIMN